LTAERGRAEGWPLAVFFDLDGTLIDSVGDLAEALNVLLAKDGLGPLTVPAVRNLVGNGIRRLVERGFVDCGMPFEGPALDTRYAAMMEIYGRGLTNHTTLMPGAEAALGLCRRKGARVAVITNKPETFSRQILAHFGLSPLVELVIGGDTGPARKPAPDMLRHAAFRFGVEPGNALMIGDGPADIDAAKAAGVPSIAVEGGYTTVPVSKLGATRVIPSLADLAAAVAALKVAS
jgi:phosphoglycolate phosphatase